MDEQNTAVPNQNAVLCYQSACPACGYCPHCGRSGYMQPQFWPPYQPYIVWSGGNLNDTIGIPGSTFIVS